MSDNNADMILADDGEGAAAESMAATRPANLPEKFWDADARVPRVDALAKSYTELERRLGETADVPDVPDAYDISLPSDTMAVDPAVNERLHKAGFTQAQAQLVYDMAAEFLGPTVASMADQVQADGLQGRLSTQFGGEENWGTVSNQLQAWAERNLPRDAFQALSNSYEGVMAMHRMMAAGEPPLGRVSGPVNPTTDESGLREMMRDPRYWRDQDPAYVEQVREGFRRLYPD